MRILPIFFGIAWLAGAVHVQAPAVADARPRLPAGMGEGTACAVADLDGDGRADVIRAEGTRLRILMQDAAGVFAEHPQQPPIAFAGEITVLALGRFDRDADLDLFVGLAGAPDELLENDGNGVLSPVVPSPFPPSVFPATTHAVAADLDGRRADDLLVLAANAPPRLLLSTAMAAAAFVDATHLLPQLAASPRDAADAADLDRDGDQDLVLGGSPLASALVLLNDGTGDFRRNHFPIATPTPSARHLRAADLTRDGWPDLVIAPDGTAPQPLAILQGGPGPVFTPVPASPFAPAGCLAIDLADVDGDGAVDVLVVQVDGALLLGRGPGDGTFGRIDQLLPPAGRRSLAVVDLEGDGDPDVVAPGTNVEDVLLLGDGRGRFIGTEDRTAPIGARLRADAVAAVDAIADGDPDLVLVSFDGDVVVWRNDGSGCFGRSPASVAPRLPPGGAYTSVRAVRLAAGGVSSRDLLVLGQPTPFHPAGVRALAWSPTGYADVSSQTLTQPQAGRVLTAMAVATFGAGASRDGASDLVLGDASGRVTIHRLGSSGYAEIANAVPHLHAGAIVEVLVGDVDGDSADDLVVLPSGGPPVVQRATGTSQTTFRRVQGAVQITSPARAGLLADLTGDGLLDLLLATPRRVPGLTLLLGRPNALFVDVTPQLLAGVADLGTVVALAQLDDGRVAIGRASGEDVVLRGGATRFSLESIVPLRGSRNTAGFVVADLDLDGDRDLVVMRDGALPAVLAGTAIQLVSRGVGQRGHTLRLLVSGSRGALGFVLFSPLTTRTPLPGYGVLRLVAPATLVATPLSGRFDAIDLTVPPTMPPLELPLQVVSFDPASATVRVGNLERATVTRF